MYFNFHFDVQLSSLLQAITPPTFADICHSTSLCHWLNTGHQHILWRLCEMCCESLHTHTDTWNGFTVCILLDFCRRATHPERTRTVKNLVFGKMCHTSTELCPACQTRSRQLPQTRTCIYTHVQTPQTLVSHPTPSLSVYHPDPDTVAKGARGGGGACIHTKKNNHSGLCKFLGCLNFISSPDASTLVPSYWGLFSVVDLSHCRVSIWLSVSSFLYQTCFEVLIRYWQWLGLFLQLGNMQISAAGWIQGHTSQNL